MTTKKYITITLIALAILVWAYSASKEVVTVKSVQEKKQELLIPDLAKNIENVGTVLIRSKGKSFKVHRQSGSWVMPNKYDYPVDVEKIRDLVQNSARIEILEAKTSDPANYESLGLDDPEKESSKAIRIVLLGEDGKTKYADYIRGINRKAINTTKSNEIYARLFNSKQAYLVKADLNFDLSAHTLLSGETFVIKYDRLKSITFDYLKGTTDDFTIGKDIPGQLDFAIINPADVKLKAFGKANAISTSLENMELLDIIPADKFPVADYEVEITYKTFSGLSVYVKLYNYKDDHWIAISAAASDEKDKQAREDADKINHLASKWVYKVDYNSTGGFYYKLSDLVKE